MFVKCALSAVFIFYQTVYSLIKLASYICAVRSANIYETGRIYQYDEDFNEDDHSYYQNTFREGARGEGMLTKEYLDSLRHFTCNELIPNFKDQRDEINGGKHFCVLLLLDHPISELSHTEKSVFDPLRHNKPYVDSNFCSAPKRELYGNYVVTRPQFHRVNDFLRRVLFFSTVPEIYYEHAEDIALNEFDILKGSFKKFARSVILFTWLFPCDSCTLKIVNKLGPSFREANPGIDHVIIVFAIYWRRLPVEVNENNRNKLIDAGCDIVRVKYMDDDDE